MAKVIKETLPAALILANPIEVLGGAFAISDTKRIWRKLTEPPAFVDTQQITTASPQPRTMVFGQTIGSGPIVKYQKITADKKDYNHFFTPLASHVCESIELYQLDGKANNLLTGDGYRIIIEDGTQTTANSTAVSEMSNVNSDSVGNGVAYAYHRYLIDPDLFPNGVQDVKFLIKGARLYDPRKDTTQGGSGTHRYSDESTWEWTDNSALVNFHFKRFGGDIDLPIELFDLSNIAFEAEICDEVVSFDDAYGSPQTEKRFTCNGMIDLSASPEQIEASLLSSCAGRWVFSGGKYYLLTAAYRGPALVTIVDNDVKGTVKRRATTPLEDRCNAVKGQHVSPRAYYQTTDITPVISDYYRFGSGGSDTGRDKGRYLEHTNDLPYTQSDTMAQRLNRLYLEYNAAGDTLELKLGWRGLLCAAGTTIRVSLSKELINKEYDVLDCSFDSSDMLWTVIAKETAASIYADTIIPATTDLTPNTDIDNTVVEPASDITYTPAPNDSYRQGYLSWQHPVPNSVVNYRLLVVSEPEGTFSRYFYPPAEYQDINGLDIGNYKAYLEAKNRFGRYSFQIVEPFSVAVPVTPTGSPVAVDIGYGYITLTPIAPPNINAIYEGLWTLSPSLDPNVDDHTLFKVIEAGKSLTILGVLDGQTYYLWYRLKTAEGEGLWIVRSYVGVGIAIESLAPDLQDAINAALDENLASTILALNRDFPLIRARLTDEEVRTIAHITNEAKAEIAQQLTNVKVENAESNIVRIDAVSANSATVIEQINSSVDGIYARATNYTRTAVGYWNGNTWIDGPISEDIRELRIDTGNGYARLSDLTQVFEDKDGNLVARGAILTDVNGLLSGVVNHNDGSTGQFDILATNFRVGIWDATNEQLEAYLYADSEGLNITGKVTAKSLLIPTAGGKIQASTDAGADGMALSMGTGASQTGGITMYSTGRMYVYNNSTNGASNVPAISILASQTGGGSRLYGLSIADGAGGINCASGTISTNTGDHFATSGDFTALNGDFNCPNGAYNSFTAQHPFLLPKQTGTNPVGLLLNEKGLEDRTSLNGALTYSGLSSKSRDPTAVGVVSVVERLIGKDVNSVLFKSLAREVELKDTYNLAFANAVGDGLMRVCSESGDIQQGRWLCSSSTLGHAMLQTDEFTDEYEKYCTDYTVAKSREEVIWANEPENTKLIAVYYKGG
jgi:hypothetical protein